MFKTIVAGLMGGINTLSGLFMLVDGEGWYTSTPGVAATGPFNSHFVADVGMAFIAAGLALMARSWRSRFWPAAVAGSAFLVFHAMIHIVEFALLPHDLASMLGIAGPAALAMWSATPSQGDCDAQRLRPSTD